MNDEIAIKLTKHLEWLNDVPGGERANLHDAALYRANLHGADLRDAALYRANLHGADLRDAALYRANLRGADLRDADLYRANLSGADLRGADLRGADLSDANLSGADLRGADLRGAAVDFSCWPLWCGSKDVKVARRIAAQLAAHLCALDCDDPDYIAARDAIMEFAKTSHRAGDLGLKGGEG